MSEQASECSGTHEQSKQGKASVRVNGASEQANGRGSGPVLSSRFLVDLTQSALVMEGEGAGESGFGKGNVFILILVAQIVKCEKREVEG